MVFVIIISSLIGALIFFTILYYVVVAAVTKGILNANFVDAIKLGIQAANEPENQVNERKTAELKN